MILSSSVKSFRFAALCAGLILFGGHHVSGQTPASPQADQKKQDGSKSADQKMPVVKKQKAKRRIVSFSGGTTRLDAKQWPILGKPDAKYILVEMFDYTCPHCRKAHDAVHGARQRYGDDFAVIALPVPLNRACNNAVNNFNPKHAEACEIAKLAVAVWRVDRTKFEKFHEWLFKPEHGRTAAAARAFAGNLVGQAKLTKEYTGPVVKKYIAKHVEFYQRAGAGQVPKLLFPRTTIVGQPGSADSLCSLIERELKTARK